MSFQAVITRYSISIEGMPSGRPLRIALFADLHACAPFMDLPRIDALVAQTNALEADVIGLLGDYVGHLPFSRKILPRIVADHLAKLHAPMGVFAVFGNHDWRDDPEAQTKGAATHWHSAFEESGIPCLNNTMTRLPAPFDRVQLVGLDSQRAFQTFWDRNLRGADDFESLVSALEPENPILLLAHEPDIFPQLPDFVDLTMSGHTHRGQVAPFGFPLVVPSIYGRRYAYGHHMEGSKNLVVSGGLGCSGLPIRLCCPPELVVIDVCS